MVANHGPLVLVVDDDSAVRKGVQGVLECEGFSVLLASDGQTGVQTFAEHAEDIALVLLDLAMPVMRGDQALEQMLAIRPGAHVVIMSGSDEDGVIERCAGLCGFLRKPFKIEDLLAEVTSGVASLQWHQS